MVALPPKVNMLRIGDSISTVLAYGHWCRWQGVINYSQTIRAPRKEVRHYARLSRDAYAELAWRTSQENEDVSLDD
jgi:hypothetical protein